MGDSKEISIGERLSSARKKKRLRYKKLSSELNIEESYLIALEEENFHLIPGGEAYVKGFLRSNKITEKEVYKKETEKGEFYFFLKPEEKINTKEYKN